MATTRVKVKSDLLKWARERARLTTDVLEAKFPKLEQWESGTLDPTLKQLQDYAKATHAPVGFLLLPEAPAEPLPIPDFRTMGGAPVTRPSPNLLDTIYICQERQAWYREYAVSIDEPPLSFVGSATTASNVSDTAQAIRDKLGFSIEARKNCPTWTEALRMFIGQADSAGVLVMCSGVVMNNNRRTLDPQEFRGFALTDDQAPLVFVNGADTKSAQMFTLAHELAHIWLGNSALSDATVAPVWFNQVERWCNQVAAEMLAPLSVVQSELRPGEPVADTLSRLARYFKVSTLVVLRRLLDVGQLTRGEFEDAYTNELAKLKAVVKKSSGGDFYLTAAARASKRFTRALVGSTLEGRTLYRDAFRLLGISKTETFHQLGRSLDFKV